MNKLVKNLKNTMSGWVGICAHCARPVDVTKVVYSYEGKYFEKMECLEVYKTYSK